MEAYGNQNLMYPNGGQFISYAGTSEASAALDERTIAVEIVATTDCWVNIGGPGETPTAAKPGAEATRGVSVPLRAEVEKTFAINLGNATNKVKIAVIQDSAAGVLQITERRA